MRARARALLGLLSSLAALLVMAAPLAPAARAAQPAVPDQPDEHQGVQAGWSIDDRGNVQFVSSFSFQSPVMHEAEASWVRINFRLGACFRDWTSVGCNGRTALATYDEVVDVALTNNLRVLALVGHEAWPGTQDGWTAGNAEHAGGTGDNPYLRRFADDAVAVLATQFSDRIGDWEIWNEPDAWTERDERGRPKGGSFIYPSNFAWVLTHAYATIKFTNPDAVVLSGGLFGNDLGDPVVLFARTPCPTALPSGGDYLCGTYERGIEHAGWGPGAFPFDHVGQHIYIDGGSVTSEERLRYYLDDLRDVYVSYEGSETTKMTHLTEFGWQTVSLSEEAQVENLLIAFDTFRQAGYVARAYWFHAQDVPEADLRYGLADNTGRRKRSLGAYQAAASYPSPPAPGRRDASTDPAGQPGARDAGRRDAQPVFRPSPAQLPTHTPHGGRP